MALNENALPACKQKQSTTKELQNNCTNNTQPMPACFDWVHEYVLSKDEANAIADPEWIIPNLVISGHLVLIPAEPNGGKTTIMFHLAGQMAKKGYEVFYVNTDISGGDAKSMVEQAETNHFILMLPDMKASKSMNTVISKLTEMSETGSTYNDVVFIFDTLKKMVNVISKSAAKNLFQLLRKLSAKGMTVVLLAHTNKYTDKEGLPIYEGTGDMRADVDDLIYLIPQKHDDGSMTVTTMPNKQRGAFIPISFNIDPNRDVTLLNEVVDTLTAKKIEAERKDDEVTINSITQAILAGNTIQKDIISYCNESAAIGERAIKRVLIKYSLNIDEEITLEANVIAASFIWNKTRGGKNSYKFSLIEPIV